MSRQFLELATFSNAPSYRLLPFRFARLDDHREILVTDWGDWTVQPSGTVQALVARQLSTSSPAYLELKAKQLVYDDSSSPLLDVAAAKLRTKKSFIGDLVSLHIFVVSLRCEHSCVYCQVSRQSTDASRYDMSRQTALKALDVMFQAPAKDLTLELQGGEPLLAFDLIAFIVEQAEERAARLGKSIHPVITTNLALVTDKILDYCRAHKIRISTSLDGPAWLHNRNRPRPGGDSHALATEGIRRAQEALGPEMVSALMTTTQLSLGHPEEIIDEYVRCGLGSVFLRPLSPYGFAVRSQRRTGYDVDSFIDFYRKGLRHILGLARGGVPIQEVYATLVFSKLLTPYATGYVDLDSPSGAGLRAWVYNYDGNIFASDEARMLAEMGDTTFRLGHVAQDTFRSIIEGDVFAELLSSGLAEGIPGCSDCALQPFCGGDPVFHHSTQGDAVGHRPTSSFCRRNLTLIRELILLWDTSDRATKEILWSWIHGIAPEQLRQVLPLCD